MVSVTLVVICFQMREVIYSRDQRVNRHKFDGVDPVVLYPLDFVCHIFTAVLFIRLPVIH